MSQRPDRVEPAVTFALMTGGILRVLMVPSMLSMPAAIAMPTAMPSVPTRVYRGPLGLEGYRRQFGTTLIVTPPELKVGSRRS